MNIIETNLKFRTALTNRNSTNRIIIHHAEASHCTAQDIHQWHLNNGWSGAGYHFLVRKDGTVYRLRPENKIGAHASGSNSDSIGICFEGSYMTETMPQAQINIKLAKYRLIEKCAQQIAQARIFLLQKLLMQRVQIILILAHLIQQ